MSRSELPDPPAQLELERLLGAWYVLFSNRGDWRTRTHPRVELAALPSIDGRARLEATLRFRSPDLLGRDKARVTSSEVFVGAGDPPGLFGVRAPGLVRLGSARFSVAAIADDDRWALIWHSRSSLGNAAGLDVYTRDPSIAQTELDTILRTIAGHPFLASRSAGCFATKQHWFPPEPYRLEACGS